MLSESFLLPLFTLGAILYAYRFIQRRNSAVHKLRCAPATEKHWLWGHEYAIWSEESNVKHSQHSKWAASLGAVYRIKAPMYSPDVIVTSDNLATQHITQHCYRYIKSPEFRPTSAKWLGKGVLWAEGEEHKHQRRLLAPVFTLASVKGMTDDVIASVESMSIRLQKHLAGQEKEVTTNISPFVSSCTLDIIGRVAFGHDFGGGQSADARSISSSWHRDVQLAHTFAGFCAPLLIVKFPWIQKLPIAALQNEGVAKQVAIRIGSEMIRNFEAAPDSLADSDGGKNILSILLNNQRRSTKESERLDERTMLENISTLIMVGHETTACTVNFSLYELAGHPEVQAKLRREILELGSELTYESISNLPYLDAVSRECLRLHSASPRTDRVAVEDDVIPLSKPIVTTTGETLTSLPVKAGQVIQIAMSVMNTDPEIWGETSHDFIPERWLSPDTLPPADKLPRGPYGNVISFLDGPRNCLGWRLAVLEYKAIMSILIRDFAFEQTGAKVEEFRRATTQSFVDGEAMMPLRVRYVGQTVLG